jgi:hypothetical protein
MKNKSFITLTPGVDFINICAHVAYGLGKQADAVAAVVAAAMLPLAVGSCCLKAVIVVVVMVVAVAVAVAVAMAVVVAAEWLLLLNGCCSGFYSGCYSGCSSGYDNSYCSGCCC